MEDGQSDAGSRGGKEAAEQQPPGPRVGEACQGKSDPAVGEQEADRPEEHAERHVNATAQAGRREEFHPPHLELRQLSGRQIEQPAATSAHHAEQEEQQSGRRNDRGRPDGECLEVESLFGGAQPVPELGDDLERHDLRRERIADGQVLRRHDEHRRVVDHDDGAERVGNESQGIVSRMLRALDAHQRHLGPVAGAKRAEAGTKHKDGAIPNRQHGRVGAGHDPSRARATTLPRTGRPAVPQGQKRWRGSRGRGVRAWELSSRGTASHQRMEASGENEPGQQITAPVGARSNTHPAAKTRSAPPAAWSRRAGRGRLPSPAGR